MRRDEFNPHARLIPPKEEVVYNGKRMRKPVTRKGVDFNASMLNLVKKRKFVRDVRDHEFIQWDLDVVGDGQPSSQKEAHPEGAKHLLPPSAMEQLYASSVCTRYTHTSINKVRYPVTALCFSPDGRRVVTGAQSGEFTLWNAQYFNFETILQAHDTQVNTMVFSHSDEYMVSGDRGGVIKYWQPNFNCLKVFTAHEQPVRQVCFSPTDLKFASCSDDGLVKLWDFIRAQEERKLTGHGWDCKTIDWHSSKGLIVSGGKDMTLRFWDPRAGKELATMHAHKQIVNKARWNGNGNWLLTSSRDTTTKLWDIRTLRELQVFRGHNKEVTTCQWHPFHEGLFMTASYDGAVNYYVVGRDAPIGRLDNAHDATIWDVAWHPFGHIVASASNDQLLRFWTRNRPGDRFDDRYGVTTRHEANVDASRLFRAPVQDPRTLGGPSSLRPHQQQQPQQQPQAHSQQHLTPQQSQQQQVVAAAAAAALADAVGNNMVIPGMSNAQTKLRRMRTHDVACTNPAMRAQRLPQTLSVLSYDLLAQTTASKRNFPNVADTFLEWKFRSQNLLLELKQRDCDVMCLQEMSSYKDFWSQSFRGYYMVFQPYFDVNANKGVAIVVRKDKLTFKDAAPVRFTDDDQTIRSTAVVATYESAAPSARKSYFVICSVSLSNYGNFDKQYEQALLLLRAVEKARSTLRHQQRDSTVHVIIAGSFNMEPSSKTYMLFTRHSSSAPPPAAGAAEEHRLGLNSAYGRFDAGRGEPAYTTLVAGWTGCTDYIFYSHSELAVRELLDFPPLELVKASGLPSADLSSNHLALSAVLAMPQ